MNRRRFLLGSSALVAATAVAKALPASAIEWHRGIAVVSSETDFGAVSPAALEAWRRRFFTVWTTGELIETGDWLLLSDGTARTLMKVAALDTRSEMVAGLWLEPALAPPA